MIVITGAAGFIGSNLVRKLNELGREDLILVEDIKSMKINQERKLDNLRYCILEDFNDFLNKVSTYDIEVIFHQGACSDTREQDLDYLLENNYKYSIELLNYCEEKCIPFIYASSAAVYGTGTEGFFEDEKCEFPLNYYALSKKKFDDYVRNRLPEMRTSVIGLRYFNVFGPGEDHKERMSSIIRILTLEGIVKGNLSVFEGSHGYLDGEQRRDFIYVDDVININLIAYTKNIENGIYNCGTGKSITFNEIAYRIKTQLDAKIKYISFPDSLEIQYQPYTEAELSRFYKAFGNYKFKDTLSCIDKYVQFLQKEVSQQNVINKYIN